MIVGVAVCPGAPLLVPELAPLLASTVPALVESCRAAVASLPPADRVLLLTSGPRLRDAGTASDPSQVVHRPGALISSAPLTGGRPPGVARRLPGPQGPGGDEDTERAEAAGVGVIVGAALLVAAGITTSTTAVELGAAADQVLDALVAGSAAAERVVLLVIAEGSAARGGQSPAGGHDAAEELDVKLAAALAAGDPTALAAVVADALPLADALMFTAGPALAALARLTMDAPPAGSKLFFDLAPLGVGYVVASWFWE